MALDGEGGAADTDNRSNGAVWLFVLQDGAEPADADIAALTERAGAVGDSVHTGEGKDGGV